jgi:carbon-monoxide dehydrogenase small subunit
MSEHGGHVAQSNELVEVAMIVNGVERRTAVEPRMLLVDCIRRSYGLTGTKIGCEQGVCGSCTVLLDGEPVRSCTTLAVQVDGCAIETIEGLSSSAGLDAVQQAFHEEHGLQCGFCTPGMVLATKALLAENPAPSEDEIRRYLSGNICRCTGYVNIVASVQNAARKLLDDQPAG